VDDSIQLKKDRFFFRKQCAYCGSSEDLALDALQPYTWVDEGVWTLNDWEFKRLFVTEVQILCDSCLRRKKQVWKRAKKEGGKWLAPYLEIPSKAITKVVD
jgi:hypothetical protein